LYCWLVYSEAAITNLSSLRANKYQGFIQRKKEKSMSSNSTFPRMEDMSSVGTRISWGAICAGCMIALGMYFLLATLAGAVGWSINDRVTPSTLEMSAIAWAFASMVVSLFVGGLVTSLFTAGEDKIEAVLYGAIMWALLFVLLLVLSVIGVHSGFNSMAVMAHSSQANSSLAWEKGARDAGVPASSIEEWRQKSGTKTAIDDPETQKTIRAAASRVTWYAFAGTWISMIAAAAGALVGAGPTFRVVAVRQSQRVLAS
jgi:hypothetical protein